MTDAFPCFHAMVTVPSEDLTDSAQMTMVQAVAIDEWRHGLDLKGARPAGEPRVSVIPGDDGMSHIMVSGPALRPETVGSPDRC
jgi:hypothetical protein